MQLVITSSQIWQGIRKRKAKQLMPRSITSDKTSSGRNERSSPFRKGAIRYLTDGSFYDMFSCLSDELDGVTATVGLPVDNVDAGTEETNIGSFAGLERQHLATAGVIDTRREIEV